MPSRYKYFVFLLAAGAFMYFVMMAAPAAELAPVRAQDGVVSFLDVDFSGGVTRVLSGWESYPGALYAPEHFAAGEVAAPVLWEKQYEESAPVGTHRMTLLLPIGEQTAIRFRSIDYATKVFIDGALVDEIGAVGTSKETTVPLIGECYFIIAPEKVETEIILQYANFHHHQGGYPPTLIVGAPQAVVRHSQLDAFSQMLIAGLLFAAFLYYFAMFLLYSERRTFLYFSLCCLAFAIRNMQPVFIVLVPVYNWALMIRLEYIDLFAGAALLLLFFQNLFPKALSGRVLYSAAALLFAYCAVVVCTPTMFFSRMQIAIQPFCVTVVGYIAVRLGVASKKRGLVGYLAFVGITFFFLTVVNDVLRVNNLPSASAFLMPVGIAVFTLTYMMILSMEFAENERRLEAEAGRLSMEMRVKEQALAADNAALDRLNRMKTDLIAFVTHETLTPLAVLSGYAQLVAGELRRKGVDEQSALDLNRIAEEARRIAGLMDELQTHVRRQDGRVSKTRLDITELINGAARMYTPILRRRTMRLSVEIHGKLPDVYACAGEITQVLFNLLHNAYSHAGGGSVTVSARADGEFVAIAVSDTGHGIPPEIMARVLERGVTGSDTGTGLGLSICKEIVDGHSGAIGIVSEQGKGTEVRFTLPAWKESVDAGRRAFAAGG